MTIGFVPLQDLSGWWFCFVMRFQWRLFLSSDSRFQWWSVLFFNEISTMVGFVWLRDLCRFCLVMRSQWQSVWFCYTISMTVEFETNQTVVFLLQDFSDGQFCSVMRFQWQSVFIVSQSNFHLFSYETSIRYFLFFYKILMADGFVS